MAAMTSSRPYLLRALYEWICDNGTTPYVLVDAEFPGVKVPGQAIKDGKIVLNLAPRAVQQLELGADAVSFQARFSGVAMKVFVPIEAIVALYAMENGQGMIFPPESSVAEAADADSGSTPGDETATPDRDPPAGDRPARGPHLRVIK